jgi:hypothetical protein
MGRCNWANIMVMSLALIANLVAAWGAAFLTVFFSFALNIDLLESGDWTPSTEAKFTALLKVSFVSTVFLILCPGIASIYNFELCKSVSSNKNVARTWTIILGAFLVLGVFVGAALCAVRILQET